MMEVVDGGAMFSGRKIDGETGDIKTGYKDVITRKKVYF